MVSKYSTTVTREPRGNTSSAAPSVNPSPSPPINTRGRGFPASASAANRAMACSEPGARVDISACPLTSMK